MKSRISLASCIYEKKMQKANCFLRRRGTNLTLAVSVIYVNFGRKYLQKNSSSRRSKLA